jgi:hypothetical protein
MWLGHGGKDTVKHCLSFETPVMLSMSDWCCYTLGGEVAWERKEEQDTSEEGRRMKLWGYPQPLPLNFSPYITFSPYFLPYFFISRSGSP